MRTPNEILDDFWGVPYSDKKPIIAAMKEYAKQWVDELGDRKHVDRSDVPLIKGEIDAQ